MNCQIHTYTCECCGSLDMACFVCGSLLPSIVLHVINLFVLSVCLISIIILFYFFYYILKSSFISCVSAIRKWVGVVSRGSPDSASQMDACWLDDRIVIIMIILIIIIMLIVIVILVLITIILILVLALIIILNRGAVLSDTRGMAPPPLCRCVPPPKGTNFKGTVWLWLCDASSLFGFGFDFSFVPPSSLFAGLHDLARTRSRRGKAKNFKGNWRGSQGRGFEHRSTGGFGHEKNREQNTFKPVVTYYPHSLGPLYIYIYIYICISLSLSLYIYIYIYAYIHIYIYKYIYIYIYTYVYLYIWTNVFRHPLVWEGAASYNYHMLISWLYYYYHYYYYYYHYYYHYYHYYYYYNKQWNRNARPRLEPQIISLDKCNIN